MTTNITPAAARAEIARRAYNKTHASKKSATNPVAFGMTGPELLAIASPAPAAKAPARKAPAVKAPAKKAPSKADPAKSAAWALASESGHAVGSREFWACYKAIRAAQNELVNA